jgi:hypothetical protein
MVIDNARYCNAVERLKRTKRSVRDLLRAQSVHSSIRTISTILSLLRVSAEQFENIDSHFYDNRAGYHSIIRCLLTLLAIRQPTGIV